jgi:hypothetical protein
MPNKRTGKSKTAKKVSNKITFANLRKYNFAASLLFALQGILILIFSDSQKGVQSVTSNYLAQDKVASEAAGRTILSEASHHLFDINLAHVVAAFLIFSAALHLLVAVWLRKRYENDLNNGINRVRWIGYAFSAGTMIVAIALLSGIYDFASILMIFSLTVLMSILGLLMELRNQGLKTVDWSNYWIGIAAGLVPWLIFIIYIWNAVVYGNGVQGFVYWIYGSMFLLFAAFAVNVYLQYMKLGRWSIYLNGEMAYIILSVIAQSALAWQIFAGTLI